MRKILFLMTVLLICSGLNAADTVITITKNAPDDCLYNMAMTQYGNPSLWPALKDYNNIADERKIPNGKKIYIPDKSVAQSIMNATTPQDKQNIINNAKNNQGNTPPPSPGNQGNNPPPSNTDPDSPPYNMEKAFGSKKVN